MGLQIREHDLIAGCRVRGQSQPVACAGLQIDRDVGRKWVEGTDVFQVVDVLTVAIADRVVIFADEYLRILLSATWPEHIAIYRCNINSSHVTARTSTHLKRSLKVCSRSAKSLVARDELRDGVGLLDELSIA